MDSFLMHSSYEAFTTEWIKHKLQEQLKDEIIVTEINGKPNVVTFRMITAKIFQIFITNKDIVIQQKKKRNE